MAAEVSPRELGQRLLALEGPCGGRPLLEQRVGVLLSAPGTARDEPLQLGSHQEVG